MKCNHPHCALEAHESDEHQSGRGRNFSAPTPADRGHGLSISELVAFYVDEHGRLGTRR